MCKLTLAEVTEKFGVNPEYVGNRFRGWWIVEFIEDEERRAVAEIGDLCVEARDGGGNPIDPGAFRVGNCVGSAENGTDCTYRYYYYRALAKEAPHA